MKAMNVHVNRYRLNRLLCWHGRAYLRIQVTSNDVTAYCQKCLRKHGSIGRYDGGTIANTDRDESAYWRARSS